MANLLIITTKQETYDLNDINKKGNILTIWKNEW